MKLFPTLVLFYALLSQAIAADQHSNDLGDVEMFVLETHLRDLSTKMATRNDTLIFLKTSMEIERRLLQEFQNERWLKPYAEQARDAEGSVVWAFDKTTLGYVIGISSVAVNDNIIECRLYVYGGTLALVNYVYYLRREGTRLILIEKKVDRTFIS